ncbi:hypothetical protein ACFCV9_30060 [Streptomyces sp. NPDC056367]|uniref:hypothetical protein n=1 Tax=Streptomyces sp. NPDC056367 TaxID=3345797 RepID=UPI0035DCE48D
MEPHTNAPLVTPLVPVPLQRPQLQSQPAAGHITSTAERGSFCLAVCSCGWTGPARRSRDLARKDASRHTTG